MFTGIYQSATILVIVVAYYALDAWLIARYDKQRQAAGSGRSWSYTLMILGMVALLIAQPLALPWLGLRTGAAWGALIQTTGLAVTAGALALHAWARVHLQRFYAERVELQPDHRIVESGPYAYVRHPVFTSFFLHVIGLVLINPALTTFLMAAYTFWDFSRAAKQEEALLSRNVPGYADYVARTARFFPKLLRRSGDQR